MFARAMGLVLVNESTGIVAGGCDAGQFDVIEHYTTLYMHMMHGHRGASAGAMESRRNGGERVWIRDMRVRMCSKRMTHSDAHDTCVRSS